MDIRHAVGVKVGVPAEKLADVLDYRGNPRFSAREQAALEPHLAEGVAVAIDGQIYQDALFQPIGPDSEVFLLPQIAGGSAR